MLWHASEIATSYAGLYATFRPSSQSINITPRNWPFHFHLMFQHAQNVGRTFFSCQGNCLAARASFDHVDVGESNHSAPVILSFTLQLHHPSSIL